jgi:ribosome-associated protein
MWLRSSLPSRTPDAQPTPEPEALSGLFTAVRAAESKKGIDLRVLDLRDISSFTDYFLICTGANQRQIQAISDEVGLQLKMRGRMPLGVEGYERAEWVLADYGDFIVHIFSESARSFYDLERLWRHARDVAIPQATT